MLSAAAEQVIDAGERRKLKEEKIEHFSSI